MSSNRLSSIAVALDTNEIPRVYSRLAQEIGEGCWLRRVRQIDAHIAQHRFFRDYLLLENAIAYQLVTCGRLLSEHLIFPIWDPASSVVYPAMRFAAQALSMMDLANPVEPERLRKRIADAIENPNNMRGLRLELGIATHFAHMGWPLEWPEMIGTGTFDLFLPDLGPLGLEVECKAISEDKGRAIHRYPALELRTLLEAELGVVTRNLRAGLTVVVTLPGRLSKDRQALSSLARAIRDQIYLGSNARLSDGSEIRVESFDLTAISELFETGTSPPSIRAAVDSITRTKNSEATIIGARGGGAIAFVVQSIKPVSLIDETFKTLGEASRKQLTGTRPGLLVAGFDGLSSEEMISLAEHDTDQSQQPSQLGRDVQPFLSSCNRDHVVSLAFLSRDRLSPRTGGYVDSGGAAYYFRNTRSHFWRSEFDGLFRAL